MIHQKVDWMLDYTHGATLFFFGDMQWGADGFAEEAWQEFRRVFKATPNARAIGLGDYGDFLRPSMRARIQGQYAHDMSARVQQDDLVRRNSDDLIKMMDFLTGKMIGLHNGHHCWEFATGDNSDMRIANALKTRYMGWQGSTWLNFHTPKKKKEKETIYSKTLVSLHGTGNSRFTGTDSRWLDNNIVPQFDADLYAKGHACKSDAWSPFSRSRIRTRGTPGVKLQVVRCLNVPGFCDGFTNGWESTYAEKAGFQRQAVGYGVAEFTISSAHKNQKAEGLSSSCKTLQIKHYIKNFDEPSRD